VYRKGEKVNLLLAICGDDVGRMCWHLRWKDGGTTIERCYNFIDHILDDMAQNLPGRSFVFTMDNLNAHKNPLILNVLLSSCHRYEFHALYWPVNGAVEYVFNSIQSKLRIYFKHLETIAISLLFNLETARRGRSVLFSDEQKLMFEVGKKGFAKNTKLDFMSCLLNLE
jgi:hypothetical protein